MARNAASGSSPAIPSRSPKASTVVPTPPRAAMLFTTLIACPATWRAFHSSHGEAFDHADGGTSRSTCSKPNMMVVYRRKFSLIAGTVRRLRSRVGSRQPEAALVVLVVDVGAAEMAMAGVGGAAV